MTYLSECLTDSPTWILALDEASGATASDSSGNANDGTYNGTPEYQEVEIIGGVSVARFDGASNYMTLDAANNVTPPYTLECFAVVVPPVAFTSGRPWIGHNDGANGPLIEPNISAGSVAGMRARAPTASGSVTLGVSSTTLTNTGPFTVFDRHHYAFVVDTNAVYLYIDGELAQSNTFVTPSSWNQTLQTWGFSYSAVGYVALYESALSAARIAAHWSAATRIIGPPTSTSTAPEDELEIEEEAVVTKPVSPDFDGATITDTAQMTVLLSDTDSLTMTDANGSIAYNFYDTDTTTIASATNSRTDPNIAVSDLARITERAVMFPSDPADWPLSPYYDAIIANPTVDISDPAVLYADDPSIYDVDIANPTSDFTTSTTDGTINHG